MKNHVPCTSIVENGWIIIDFFVKYQRMNEIAHSWIPPLDSRLRLHGWFDSTCFVEDMLLANTMSLCLNWCDPLCWLYIILVHLIKFCLAMASLTDIVIGANNLKFCVSLWPLVVLLSVYCRCFVNYATT